MLYIDAEVISAMYGNQLKQKRRDLGMTQAQLAKHLGVRQHQISLWENERNKPIRITGNYIEAVISLLQIERKVECPTEGTHSPSEMI